jgi:hypothetical protein
LISSPCPECRQGQVAAEADLPAGGRGFVIVDFEKGRSTPVTNNPAAIQRVLEEAGVEFTNGDAPGLRLRKKKR